MASVFMLHESLHSSTDGGSSALAWGYCKLRGNSSEDKRFVSGVDLSSDMHTPRPYYIKGEMGSSSGILFPSGLTLMNSFPNF